MRTGSGLSIGAASDGSPSHGALMDRIYARQRHIYDASRKYYLLGRDRLIDALDAGKGAQVLEVGCGTGRNLICAAKRWPDARLHGIDISNAMLETARTQVDRAGLSHRIALAQGDAAEFDPGALFGTGRFDRIMLSYTLSMIPPWEMALDMAAGLLAPGGSLHIVDFGQQERLPAPFRAALFAWLAKFDVSPRGALKAVAEEVADRHRLTPRFTPLLRGYAWSAVLERRE
ncbi:class I SAM-dependent methyltransferase [Sphingobium arseniciresistens]|uniref:class I SAM-dependent methyltransferase n=1 Tax=Sphingobium arseniciresistens TaxID=3030834 RepID=UPI003BB00B63